MLYVGLIDANLNCHRVKHMQHYAAGCLSAFLATQQQTYTHCASVFFVQYVTLETVGGIML